MWNLPKIPQSNDDFDVEETYLVDREALRLGREHYASLLGIKLQGLGSGGMIEHNFTVQTSYINLDCALTDDQFNLDHRLLVEEGVAASEANEAIVYVKSPIPWEMWDRSDNPPLLQLNYFIRWYDFWSVLNCTMRTVWLETDIHCGPDPFSMSCHAYQQRRLKDKQHTDRPPRLMSKTYNTLQRAISYWSEASGDMGFKRPLATENYFMGELYPYFRQHYRNWTIEIDDQSTSSKQLSKRLTTAFNTFWDATLNPLGHTNVSFGTPPSDVTQYEDLITKPLMNSTVGTMTETFEVYRASQLWLAILLIATMFLQILAILGIILEAIIVGPEILGFASSLTRDNRYVPVPPGNSAVGGAERARLFRDIRLQIADVEPGKENGYIAVHSLQSSNVEKASTDDSEEQAGTDEASERVDTRPLIRERLYR
ncbi:hypothetical protein NW752_004204 [Fusarium irregulare]|nr:hypothetical protein NW752_004204 [Fusarium irregulare]